MSSTRQQVDWLELDVFEAELEITLAMAGAKVDLDALELRIVEAERKLALLRMEMRDDDE